jgi:hypothetical protein
MAASTCGYYLLARRWRRLRPRSTLVFVEALCALSTSSASRTFSCRLSSSSSTWATMIRARGRLSASSWSLSMIIGISVASCVLGSVLVVGARVVLPRPRCVSPKSAFMTGSSVSGIDGRAARERERFFAIMIDRLFSPVFSRDAAPVFSARAERVRSERRGGSY